MLYSAEETLEDVLVRCALRGPAHIKELHTRVVLSKKEVTLRAIYKAINELIHAGVLIKVGKNIWVNQEWIKRLKENFLSNLPILAPGEKVSYTFTSIEHLDTFWKTIALALEAYERDGQIFFYNPHNFWAYIPERKESEDIYYSHFAKERKHSFLTVGGVSYADREFKRSYQNDFLQVDTHPHPSLGRNTHITVLGDFIITVRISKKLSTLLDALYASDQPIATLLPGIVEACKKNGVTRLTFENNAAKSKKLRAKLSPPFYIPEKTI